HHYHDVHGSFPTGKGVSYPGRAAYARWSIHALLLPFIEQDPLYKSIDFNFPPETPGMQGVTGFMPPYQNPGRENAAQCRVRLDIFLCPSDGAPLAGDWPGQNNYLGSQGTQFLCDLSELQPSPLSPGEAPNGIFYFRSQVRIANVTDGTSQTA